MTQAAVTALRAESQRVMDLCASLTAEEWEAASDCAGWRVQDVVSHMASVFHTVADPATIEAGPPGDAEASAEVAVRARRDWAPARVEEDYRHWAALGLDAVAAMQEPPARDTVVPLANLGSHPLHLLANAFVFDHYCHLRYDIGPAVARAADLPEDPDALAETRVWMLAGLPQMCASALEEATTAPLNLVLEGPGGGCWTMRPAGADGLCPIEVGNDPAARATVTSTVAALISWGTKRRDWRRCAVSTEGDEELATRWLDAVNVI